MTDMSELWQWLAVWWVPLAGVLVGVAVFTWIVARRTPKNATEAIGAALEASIIARELVMAAEQLWIKGDLPADERFTWVRDQLRVKFPNLPEEDIVAAIEAAVYWLKQMTRYGKTDASF